jgi:3-oxoacyl-[acyl-carrier protein] reductase
MTLAGRTALVTGGSRGIGRAIVERLAADGAAVVFSYQDSKDTAEQLARRVGHGAVAVRADQEDLASIGALFAPVAGGLDILVNNAAVNPRVPIEDMTPEAFDRVMTVNAKFPLLAIQRAASVLRDGGRIINISTLSTVLRAPGHVLYSASKAALEQITAVAAQEFGGRGITVNAISPGATDTDLFRLTNPPDAEARTAALTALQRLGRPGDIADVAAFLAGPDSRWITGQVLRASGGLYL